MPEDWRFIMDYPDSEKEEKKVRKEMLWQRQRTTMRRTVVVGKKRLGE